MVLGGVGTEGLAGGSVRKPQRVLTQKMVAAVLVPEVAILKRVSVT